MKGIREDTKLAVSLAAEIRSEVQQFIKPPAETGAAHDESVIYFSLVRNTRGYIERVTHQINGTYENAWYDACLVMTRRLLETLIIEVYEARNLHSTIKNPDGSYPMLGDLIDHVVKEPSWTLGRKTRTALPRFKDLGDRSAHDRRFNAHRQDVDKHIGDLRIVVQDLLALAGIK